MDDKIIFRKKIIKSLIITTAILALEVGILIFIIDVISKKAAEIKERKILAISFEREAADFENLKKDYEKIKPYLGTIDSAIPNEENLFRILEAMENVGLKLGVRISLRLESQSALPSEISGVNYVPFSASFEANYDILRNYLKALNDSPIFVSVDSVSIGGGSIFNNSAIRLSGKIYTK